VRRSLRKCVLVPYEMHVRGYNFFIIQRTLRGYNVCKKKGGRRVVVNRPEGFKLLKPASQTRLMSLCRLGQVRFKSVGFGRARFVGVGLTHNSPKYLE